MKFQKQRGVVLVITLIMLSIITVMAVAFLALSRRERASVTHTQNSIDAELMAQTALERGKAEIAANIIGYSNLLGPDLLVSGSSITTNYPLYEAPYFYYGNPRDGVDDDKDLNAITNLWLDPRPPVFVGTNREQRFYLDLNRNGRFETNGVLPVLDGTGNAILDASGLPIMAHFTGDPEWFGVLSRPQLLHSRDNRFIGRYAYLILPIGRSLDLNFIHNQAKDPDPASFDSGFLRSQGVGTWEINLAGFLADLNTNVWNDPGENYRYYPTNNTPNTSDGIAFVCARELLAFRYAGNHRLLDPANSLLANAAAVIPFDGIDAYTDNPPVPLGRRPVIDDDNPAKYWPGAESKQHLFSVHDLFNDRANFKYTNFTDRLRSAAAGTSSYDRYTFYRMLAQLGTGSAPEPEGKIHINYKNTGGVSPTNFVPWTPLEFFTNAAHKMLVQEFRTNRDPVYAYIGTNGVFSIPVVLNGSPKYTNINGIVESVFSTRVYRLLQLAANIYESSVATNLPCVFKPVFRWEQLPTGNNLFITNFVQLDNNFYTSVFNGTTPVKEMTTTNGPINPTDLVYGVPLVIGARKGIPNFNEFASQNIADFTRKLSLNRPGVGLKPDRTNQMFILGISNVFAMEAWNPYTNPYPRKVNLFFQNQVDATVMLNGAPFQKHQFTARTNQVFTFDGNQFRIPGIQANSIISNAVYRTVPVPTFDLVSAGNIFSPIGSTDTNRFGLTLRNRVLYFLTEENGQILDSFSTSDFDADFDISKEVSSPDGDGPKFWDRTIGIQRQISASMGGLDANDWNKFGAMDDKNQSIAKFSSFVSATALGPGQLDWTNLTMQAPYTPTRKIIHTSRWEANDPIVHYLSDDLREYREGYLTNQVIARTVYTSSTISITNDTSMGTYNARYRPWGGNPKQDVETDVTAFDLRTKDAGIADPNYWDFPTQKFPSVGWLGRVHRGTPWQTMYLKAYPVTGDEPDRWLMSEGGPGLAMETHPTNDWKLVDLFTTAIHPNATRGQLSVNQTNFAAWSAVLSGVAATTMIEPSPEQFVPVDTFADPAAVQPQTGFIIEGLSRARAAMPNGRFEHIGDILAAPELTTASPFLADAAFGPRWDVSFRRKLVKDIDYERIPDQIMSLLNLGDSRFVVYAFGQSLKPEYIDPRTGVALNYQITGEVATRSVVRIDFDKVTDRNDPRFGGPDVNRPHVVVEQFNVLPPE